jgi:hypothetical protein
MRKPVDKSTWVQVDTGLRGRRRGGELLGGEPLYQEGVRSPGVKVVEYLGDGCSHDAAPVGGKPVVGPKVQAGGLETGEVRRSAVEGDLLFVTRPPRTGVAGLRRFRSHRRGGCRFLLGFGGRRRQRRSCRGRYLVPRGATGLWGAPEQQIRPRKAGSTRHGPSPPWPGPGTPGPRWRKERRTGWEPPPRTPRRI